MTERLDVAHELMRLGDCVADETYEVVTYSLESPVETVGGEQVPTGYTTLHVVVRLPAQVATFRLALLG